MKLLLDTTRADLGLLPTPSDCPHTLARAIQDEENDVFVSVVSVWEIGNQAGQRARLPAETSTAMMAAQSDSSSCRCCCVTR